MLNHISFPFQVSVAMVTAAGEEVTLTAEAGHGFKATLLALEAGDEVDVAGTLIAGLGTAAPGLKMKLIACTSRALAVMAMVVADDVEDLFLKSMSDAITVAFHFFWYPLVEYRPPPPDTVVPVV
jgi:hypothetical protein